MQSLKKETKEQVLESISKNNVLAQPFKDWLIDNIDDHIDIIFDDSEAVDVLSEHIINSRSNLYNQF